MSMMVKWVITTSSFYNSLETKEPNALYFLDDTKEIYRGSVEYTSSVYFVNELPELAAVGKIYVLSDTLEGKVWDGSKWNTVVYPMSKTLDDESTYNGTVSGEAIKAYVTKRIAEINGGAIGDVSADNIKTTRDIQVIGQDLGSYKDGDTIPMGTSLTDILKKQFAKQIPPTYSSPNVSISPNGTQNVESGTLVNPTIVTSFNKRDGGDLNRFTLQKIVNGVSETLKDVNVLESVITGEHMVDDGSLLKYTSTVYYDAGPIKNDNLGDPYPTGSIKAGSLGASVFYNGQRKAFFGADTGSSASANSAAVRSLKSDILNPSNGTRITIPITVGDTRVTFAYPANLKDVASVVSSSLNLDVKGTFVKTLVNVEGANGYISKQYKVYTYIPAIPFASSDTYNVTI